MRRVGNKLPTLRIGAFQLSSYPFRQAVINQIIRIGDPFFNQFIVQFVAQSHRIPMSFVHVVARSDELGIGVA